MPEDAAPYESPSFLGGEQRGCPWPPAWLASSTCGCNGSRQEAARACLAVHPPKRTLPRFDTSVGWLLRQPTLGTVLSRHTPDRRPYGTGNTAPGLFTVCVRRPSVPLVTCSLRCAARAISPCTRSPCTGRVRILARASARRPTWRPDQSNEFRQRLANLDRRSTHGAWTHATLRRIADCPGQRARELADALGRDTDALKLDIRKLKNLGLTHSLDVGYQLAPRGAAYLRAVQNDG